MQIEQDQIGAMTACELEADASLHRCHQFDVGMLVKDLLDERQIRQVVLDVKNSAFLLLR